jgi:hypothetical protein
MDVKETTEQGETKQTMLGNMAEARRHTLDQLSDPKQELERQKQYVKMKFGERAFDEAQEQIKPHVCRQNGYDVMDSILRREGNNGFYTSMYLLLSCLKNGKPAS